MKEGKIENKTNFIRADIIYAFFLFIVSISIIYNSHQQTNSTFIATQNYWVFVFFLLFILTTISMGFAHPSAKDLGNIGHVSFDRVAQVASILILGPLDAAIVNGIASLIYPWHRLYTGERTRKVIMSSLFNSGLMSLCVFTSGSLFLYFSGGVPLKSLDYTIIIPLLIMILSFEFIHELSMQLLIFIRKGNYLKHFNLFSILINFSTAICGILVAIIYNGQDKGQLYLLLILLLFAMIALKQLAKIRLRLEEIVSKRTLQLEQQSYELLRQANHDSLTSLHNRRFIVKYLEQKIRESKRYEYPLSIAIIDIDHFKSVNDNHSHAIGDEVLKRLSILLKNNSRASDTVSRYGGEEFLIVQPETLLDGAILHCEKLREIISNYQWSNVLDNREITVSIGVAQLGFLQSYREFLDQADKCLYLAKHQGRNKVIGEDKSDS